MHPAARFPGPATPPANDTAVVHSRRRGGWLRIRDDWDGHGHHAVTWTCQAVARSAQGSTLATALRRAVRAAGPRSAHPGGDR